MYRDGAQGGNRTHDLKLRRLLLFHWATRARGEERIVRKIFLSNRIQGSRYLDCRSFLYRAPSSIALLAFIKIIYSIDIDDLPPFLPEKISTDGSGTSYKKVCLIRHKNIGYGDEVLKRDDTISDEYYKGAKIDHSCNDNKKYHHKKKIEKTFHSEY